MGNLIICTDWFLEEKEKEEKEKHTLNKIFLVVDGYCRTLHMCAVAYTYRTNTVSNMKSMYCGVWKRRKSRGRRGGTNAVYIHVTIDYLCVRNVRYDSFPVSFYYKWMSRKCFTVPISLLACVAAVCSLEHLINRTVLILLGFFSAPGAALYWEAILLFFCYHYIIHTLLYSSNECNSHLLS